MAKTENCRETFVGAAVGTRRLRVSADELLEVRLALHADVLVDRHDLSLTVTEAQLFFAHTALTPVVVNVTLPCAARAHRDAHRAGRDEQRSLLRRLQLQIAGDGDAGHVAVAAERRASRGFR